MEANPANETKPNLEGNEGRLNYIHLLNNHWNLRVQGLLDSGCSDLYLYLVHFSNSLGWKNPFNISNRMLVGVLGISEPTLKVRRDRLIEAGLIEFKEGNSLRLNSVYYLKNFGSVFGRDSENSLPYNKPLPNQPKQKKDITPTGGDSESFLFYKNLAEKTIENIKDFIKTQAPQFIEPYTDYWNLFATLHSKAQVKSITESRKKKFNTRISESAFDFTEILKAANDSDFLKNSSFFTFDWILENESNYLKVIEGNYKNNATPEQKKPEMPKKDQLALLKMKRAKDLAELRTNEILGDAEKVNEYLQKIDKVDREIQQIESKGVVI